MSRIRAVEQNHDGQSDSLFAAEAQRIEHEQNSPELSTYLKASCCKLQGRSFCATGQTSGFLMGNKN